MARAWARLPGCGEDGASFKHREGQRSVVRGDVQLEDAWMLAEFTGCITSFRLHGMHQGPGVLPHLNGQHLSPPPARAVGECRAAAGQVGLKQSFDVVDKRVFHI